MGDVHGEVGMLRNLMPLIDDCDALVFVGDYVDRGRDSRGVIEELLALASRRPETAFLRGNHEELFANMLLGSSPFPFLAAGGAATITNYVKRPRGSLRDELLEEMPATHIDFLLQLASGFFAPGVSVSHLARAKGAAQQGVLHIHGHSFDGAHTPRLIDGQLAIDTGSGTPGGRLTCFTWPELEYVQVDSPGRIYHGRLELPPS